MKTLSLKPKLATKNKIIEPENISSITINPAVRVGSVPYLNTKPLTRFIASPVTKLEPTKLAAELHAGNLDAALARARQLTGRDDASAHFPERRS